MFFLRSTVFKPTLFYGKLLVNSCYTNNSAQLRMPQSALKQNLNTRTHDVLEEMSITEILESALSPYSGLINSPRGRLGRGQNRNKSQSHR